MKKKIKVLSLFDGISCARVALESLGYDVEYYASEVDKYAIQVAQKNYPDTVQLGSVVGLTKWKPIDRQLDSIDLLIGGSPCQDLSIAKQNREGLKGQRSGLFYEYLRILREVKPKYFVLENVASMPKEARDEISKELGVEPIMINASLVSAQQRKRLFWTNIPGVNQPEDRKIYLKDILESGEGLTEKAYCLTTGQKDFKNNFLKRSQGNFVLKDKPERIGQIGKGGQADRIYSIKGKSVCLSANGGGRGAKTGLYLIQTPRGHNKGGIKALDGKTPTLTSSSFEHNNKLYKDGFVRKLTPIECERLQGLPDNYTDGISNTQRYRVLGNAFNVEVIKHILTFL